MRLIRFLLTLVLVGAVILWFYAAFHGFHGQYCFDSARTCSSTDIKLKGSMVVWLAPIVALVALMVLRSIRRAALQRH